MLDDKNNYKITKNTIIDAKAMDIIKEIMRQNAVIIEFLFTPIYKFSPEDKKDVKIPKSQENRMDEV